jgi:hypothetical protein
MKCPRLLGERLAAYALLAVFCAGPAGPLHSFERADDLCYSRPVVHDAAAHRIGAGPVAAGDEGPGHCALCHWQRLLRAPLLADYRVVAAPVRSTTLTAPYLQQYDALILAELPPRAPPA